MQEKEFEAGSREARAKSEFKFAHSLACLVSLCCVAKGKGVEVPRNPKKLVRTEFEVLSSTTIRALPVLASCNSQMVDLAVPTWAHPEPENCWRVPWSVKIGVSLFIRSKLLVSTSLSTLIIVFQSYRSRNSRLRLIQSARSTLNSWLVEVHLSFPQLPLSISPTRHSIAIFTYFFAI